ncbi:MAG: hypothetical protein CBR30_00660 [Dictyoglomus sp. NZ13-RE01]|nr:MAG: hypothetical protein CBR30_00660 [Dictyoglomus sp. NZ13-RE01]
MNNFVYKYLGWINDDFSYRDVFIRTKIRLLRNVADFPFPEELDEKKRKRFLNSIDWCLKNDSFLKNFNYINFEKVPHNIAISLVEKGIIDNEIKNNEGKSLLIDKKGATSILINEEEHFQFQKLVAGFDYEDSLFELFNLEDIFSQYFKFAYEPKLGYITSSIENWGHGIKITSIIQLTGLSQSGELSSLSSYLKKNKINLVKLYEEYDYTIGSLFKITIESGISSSGTLETKVKRIINKIVEKEREARNYLMEEDKIFLEDLVSKSVGMIKYSKLLSFIGALELLSNIRLGKYLGIVSIPVKLIDVLFILVHPVHLQMRYGGSLKSPHIEILRANLLREVFKSYKIV